MEGGWEGDGDGGARVDDGCNGDVGPMSPEMEVIGEEEAIGMVEVYEGGVF